MVSVLLNTYYGNTVQQWLYAFLIILGSFVVGKIIYWITTNVFRRFTDNTETKIDDIIIDMVEEPVVFAVGLFGVWYALGTLNLPEGLGNFIGNVFQVLIVLNVAWLVTRLFDAILKEYIQPLTSETDTDLDDQVLPILSSGIKIIVWSLAIIIALNNAGYNVGALLAGLGIGGIAFAMAAKDTVANIFGGVTIFTDKPFMINDRVKVIGFDGYVREIGLRSTKLQTLEGRTVTIPNAKFADSPVENVSSEPSRRILWNLGLTYDTTPKKMQKAMDILKDIAIKNGHVEDRALVSFNGFNDSSMNILYIYYIKKGENILDTQSEMSMAILKEFNKNDLEFAFPSLTIYKA